MQSIYVYDNPDVIPNENNEASFIFSYRDVEPEDPFLEDKAMILSRYIDLKSVTFASAIMIVLQHYVPHLIATPSTAESIKNRLNNINKNLIQHNVITVQNAQAILQLMANALKKIVYVASRDEKSNAYFLLHPQNYFASTLQLTVSIIMLIHKAGEDNPHGAKNWQTMTGIPIRTLNYLEPILLNLLFPQFKLVKAEDVMFDPDTTTLVAIEQENRLPKAFPPLIFSNIVIKPESFSPIKLPKKLSEINNCSPNDDIVLGQSEDNGENIDPLRFPK